MKKLNIRNKEIHIVALFGLLALLFISINLANEYSPQGKDVLNDEMPKSAAISISITSPIPNDYFGPTEPNFVVEINDGVNPIDTMWYTIDNGITNITFTSNGTIHSGNWTARPDGPVILNFYANNSISEILNQSVTIIKDTIDPVVTIISPLGGEYFNATAPNFLVEISDSGSPIDSMWYTLNGGSNIFFTVNGTIDSGNWTALGDVPVTIVFYANDSVGNSNLDTVIVNKDATNPIVSITSPTGGEYYNATAPNFVVEISDSGSPIDSMWYTLNGGSNIFFTVNGTIDSGNWTTIGNVPVTIIFYANDSAGNLNSDTVIINKDGLNPSVSIMTPTGGEYYNATAPNFIVEISDSESLIDSMWYTLNGGSNIFFIVNGTIDSGNWTALGDVPVTIIFYANDSAGNTNSDTVIVNKDATNPTVSITSPSGGEYYDATAPNFIVEISDSESLIDSMWYTLNGGSNIFFTVNGTIDSGNWTALSDVPVSIMFYANDSAGNTNSDTVIVNKDATNPTVSITSPSGGEYYDAIAPNFVVEISDSGSPIDSMWYTLNGGSNIFFTVNGTIDSGNWTALGDVPVTIMFYANDSVGNSNSDTVIVNKDATNPTVSITSPSGGEYYDATAPNFVVEISDSGSPIDSMWYTLNGGSNIFFTVNGTIDSGNWTALGDVPVTIIFYANDSAGNSNSDTVIVNKDATNPTVSITSPTGGEYYNVTAPNFVVEISDSESLIDSMWYTLNGGANIFFIVNGTVDSGNWTALGDVPVTIIFYANDSAGNTNSDTVIVNKDTAAPTINIISPLLGQTFGLIPPSFIVEINDDILDTMWYTINGGLTNFTFTLNGTVDLITWLALPNSPVTITFFANDTLGHVNSASRNFNKNAEAPVVSIVSPTTASNHGLLAPSFVVEITDTDLDTMWYTIDGGVTNNTFVANGTIDQTEWTAHIDGPVTLIFFANDSAGNFAFDLVVINKDTVAPTVNIVSPTVLQLFGVISPNFIVEIDDLILDTMWYTLDDGLTNITFVSNGTFNLLAWGSVPNGTLTIYFYANDSVGNEAFDSVILRADKIIPAITVNLPIGDAVIDTAPYINITVREANIARIWYVVGLTDIDLANNTDQQLNILIWDALPEGQFTIELYANDTAGNLNNLYTINLVKDTSAPLIAIVYPSANATYTTSLPEIRLTISDITLDTTWYSIVGTSYTFEFTPSIGTTIVIIDQAAWNALSNGPVTIVFYANDSLGRTSSDNITIHKNVSAPFDFIAFLLGPIGLTIMGSIVAIIVVVIVLKRRKTHKTSDKEVRKIESLWD